MPNGTGICRSIWCLIYTDITHAQSQSHTHTHTRLTALFSGLPGWAGTRKVKPIWILLKQETVSGSGISWVICKSAPCSRQITMPATHHSSFLQAGCPSYHPNNSVKALKGFWQYIQTSINSYSTKQAVIAWQTRIRIWQIWNTKSDSDGGGF